MGLDIVLQATFLQVVDGTVFGRALQKRKTDGLLPTIVFKRSPKQYC